MKAIKLIKDPEAFNLLGDPTRRRIIHLLRAKERTVSQIAEELGLTPQAIYHHIRKMKDADLVEIAKEERVEHFIETYYRASAEIFHLSHGEGTGRASEEKQTKEVLQNLSKIGIKTASDPETVSKVVAAALGLKSCMQESGWFEKVNELEDVDFFTQQGMIEYACLATMSDKDFETHMDNYRELRRMLKHGAEGHPSKKKG
jgi:DNA-binding transcriptional ArsR family regulator